MRKVSGAILFESFEVDPPNAEIMGTIGRVRRTFPGTAINVPDETAMDPSFQRELISFLAQMDAYVLEDSSALTRKANSDVPEERDTADPHFITELLTAILRGLSGSRPMAVGQIEKHIRNDILWKDAYKPWRRSTLWLITRVALQTTLERILGQAGKMDFKAFMIFLMSSIPCYQDCTNISSDSLFCMRAKLARRVSKLSPNVPEFVISEATKAVDSISSMLKARWRDLQAQYNQAPLWTPGNLDIEADTQLSLLHSKEYIRNRLSQAQITSSPNCFQPTESPRLSHILEDLRAFTVTNLREVFQREPMISLIDIETFVAKKLDQWVEFHLYSAPACETLSDCLEFYAQSATKLYKGNPENESIKFLTLFQLWVALDRLVTTQIPLLLDYSPEVPETILDPLLIRDPLFIQRLLYVQTYLSTRRENAHDGSVFTPRISERAFAVRYYDSSQDLQSLRSLIETEAQKTREAKCREFHQKENEYDSILQQAASLDHTYTYSQNGKQMHNIKKCNKCRQEKMAQQLVIGVHEWPLPSRDLILKATVFETRCPYQFQMWRTSTYMLLHDVCRPNKTDSHKDTPPVSLENYNGLRNYLGDLSRVTYASSTKSYLKSHYSSQKVSIATIDSICVNNGLNFGLYDSQRKRWVLESFTDCGIDELCTYKLSSTSPYHPLQGSFNIATEASNVAISSRASAPTEFSLHEYLSFSTLRCGPNLQWLNIARELRTGILSFSRIEVQMLIAQTATQMGSFSTSFGFDWHILLKDQQFGSTLLSGIEGLLSNIEGNWLHIISLRTAILLINQLLSNNTDATIVELGCGILKRCRDIAFAWVETISDVLTDADSETTINELQYRICDAALACRAAYHVDRDNIDSASDITKLVYCSILLNQNLPPDSSTPDGLRFFIAQDLRLSNSIISVLRARIKQRPDGLNNAITKVWSDFPPRSDWKQLACPGCPNGRWLTVSSRSRTCKSTIHLNLLDGTLLINGKPIKRLPSSVTTHPTYMRILGSVCIRDISFDIILFSLYLLQKTLDVIPSDVPNMEFATRKPISSSGFHVRISILACLNSNCSYSCTSSANSAK